jgi:hypothetical protein
MVQLYRGNLQAAGVQFDLVTATPDLPRNLGAPLPCLPWRTCLVGGRRFEDDGIGILRTAQS